MLHTEMQVTRGHVPDPVGIDAVRADGVTFGKDEFWFATPEGVRFHYQRGRGIIAEIPEGDLAYDDFRIFLWGTVYGAVAWLNGCFPLHASAIVSNGRAIAFTADSGGGKSTLAAALAARGFPHLCDDTLVLAMAGDRLVGVPDRKPLKLWADAARFIGADTGDQILGLPGKFYGKAARSADVAAPLTDLIVLVPGEKVAFVEAEAAAAKLKAFTEAMYRPAIAVVRGDEQVHGAWLFELLRSVRVWRFERPTSHLDHSQFDWLASALEQLPVGALR
ncbi:hypothetical protein [Tsuneonella dongtanensis]|nr:hypothetical protein [Tsuneonella dongtanensis]